MTTTQTTPQHDLNVLSNDLLRSNKIVFDHRKEIENIRYQIVEVKPFVTYHLIVKQGGETTEIVTASSKLILLLKHLN